MFRKGLLALAVAGLGLVGTASAQVTNSGAANTTFCPAVAVATTTAGGCGANYTGNGALLGLAALRAEGLTEQLPPVVITGFAGTTNTTSITIVVTTSAPLTNVVLTGSTTNQTDATAIFTNWPGNAQTAVTGVMLNSTQMSFTLTGVTLNTAVTAATGVIIENLRVNVSALAAGSTVTVVPSGTATGGVTFTAASTALAVGITQTSLAKATFTGYGNIALCAVSTKDVNAVGTVVIKDAFAGAFTMDAGNVTATTIPEADKELVITTAVTGGTLPFSINIPNGETNPAAAALNGTVGTRIALTFSGLASGVNYYLPATVTNNGLTLVAVASASSTTAAGPATAVNIGGTGNNGNTNNYSTAPSSPGGQAVNGLVLYTATGGSFTAYYGVTATNGTGLIDATGAFAYVVPNAPVYASITLFEVAPTISSVVPAAGAPSVTVSLTGNTAPLYAQFSSTGTAVSASASSAAPPAAGNPGSLNGSATGQLSSCSTTILFPYLIQGLYGYTTGIDIANASLGTSVTGNTVTSSNGTCTLKLWGTVNGTALTTPITLSPGQITVAGSDPMTIAAGQTGLFSLGSVPNGTATLTGYLGYGVATCNFQQAHAFALTTDGIGDSNGYLGVVIGDVFNNGIVAQNDAQ